MAAGSQDGSGGSRQPDHDLAAAIHDTTNALTVILGWVERAREAANGPPELHDALARAADNALSTRRVLRRAIGAEVMDQPPEQAQELAARSVADLAMVARRKSVTLVDQVADDTRDHGVVHPDTVWQVLTNLLLNAIEASPEGEQVVLDVARDDALIRFRVRDGGPGIPESRRGDLFTRGESGRSGGAGIGLRHAHRLAHSHGGELRLLDDGPGAHFELGWPLGPGDARPSTEQQTPTRRPDRNVLAGKRVLLLEDDPAVIELLELSLGARGATIDTAADAEAFHAHLDDGSYDAVLVDLSPLGGEIGDVCERVRERNPDTNIIVISGSITAQPRPDVTWVRKPFEPSELARAIVGDDD